MQADSEYVYKSWIEALQQGIEAAIQHSDQQNTNQFSGNNQNDYDSNNLNDRFPISNKIKKSK